MKKTFASVLLAGFMVIFIPFQSSGLAKDQVDSTKKAQKTITTKKKTTKPTAKNKPKSSNPYINDTVKGIR